MAQDFTSRGGPGRPGTDDPGAALSGFAFLFIYVLFSAFQRLCGEPVLSCARPNAYNLREPVLMQRRFFLKAAALAPAALAHTASAQTPRDWSGQQPVRYPDPDFVTLDPRFQKYAIGSAAIQRLWTGARWAEGPAWNAAGRYLVWSDIPNNRQMRWLEEDGHISAFLTPSEYSNGNTFDFEGRQISCQRSEEHTSELQ